jgi:hypothetical protein
MKNPQWIGVAAAAFGISGIVWFVWEIWRAHDNRRKLAAALQKLEKQLADEVAKHHEKDVAKELISPTLQLKEIQAVRDRLSGAAKPVQAVESPRLSDSSAEQLVASAIKLTRQP